MSGEGRQLVFAATTQDVDHWPPADLAAADQSDAPSYHDWAFEQLAEVMYAAGQAFVAAHPDVFACELT